jgi:hypothetical protein
MQRVVEQSEFLKDLCKLVIYADHLGYLVTRAEQMGGLPLDGTLPDCGVDLQFFRRNHGSLKRMDSADFLPLFGDFWKSLNSSNA